MSKEFSKQAYQHCLVGNMNNLMLPSFKTKSYNKDSEQDKFITTSKDFVNKHTNVV